MMASLEHVGIAVDRVDAVVEHLDDLLGVQPYKTETVTEQQVRTHFLDAGDAKLELLESLAPDSPVGKYVEKRGEGLHHLAFEVDDADATLKRLRAAGFTILSDEPQHGADDKRIFFVHPKETHGILVEFCQTLPPNWTPERISRDDGDLAVYERGDAARPTVICLHGASGSTLLDCAPLIRQLESSFHVVGVDLSGHGASEFPNDDRLSLDRFVADVQLAYDALDLDPCHMFGFSMGSTVALEFAHAHPDRVERLALFAPNLEWDDELVATFKTHLDFDTLKANHRERADQFRRYHTDVHRLFQALRHFAERLPRMNTAVTSHAGEVTPSTLVMGVDEDPLFPRASTEQVYQTLPNARLGILPGQQHGLANGPVKMIAPLLRQHFAHS